ncbi:hypothetical protein HDU86_003791 [Geranomyces michiganensis]|nr:hypothetical protein HDU86_003791 [Geranomyces michiganensis]
MKMVIEKWVKFVMAEDPTLPPDHIEIDVKDGVGPDIDQNDSDMAEIADLLSDLCLKGRTYSMSPAPITEDLPRRDSSPADDAQLEESVHYSECSSSEDEECWEDILPVTVEAKRLGVR